MEGMASLNHLTTSNPGQFGRDKVDTGETKYKRYIQEYNTKNNKNVKH